MLKQIKKFILSHTEFGKSRYLKFLYRYDMQNYFVHSCMNVQNTEKLATQIRLLSHAIEKGMSLPECKNGYGKGKIRELINLCTRYSEYPDRKDAQALEVARKTILEYADLQKQLGVDISFIPDEFMFSVDSPVESGVLYLRDKVATDFERVAKERHSLRYYAKEAVSTEDIESAVLLAQTAPSACNRQATHVFACVDDKKIEEIIRMHGGIRGFGKPTVIFAITGNLNLYQNEYERNTVFVDGGIFLMNFLYALDSQRIAACPIIWGAEPSNDKRISDLLSIPESHKIISLVTAGYFPESPYKVAKSPKRPIEDILHIVK